jgi:hypothetical protein
VGRKKVSDMTPEELKAYREYMRTKKAESRARRSEPEKDYHGPRSRAEDMRRYRKRKKSKESENKPN